MNGSTWPCSLRRCESHVSRQMEENTPKHTHAWDKRRAPGERLLALFMEQGSLLCLPRGGNRLGECAVEVLLRAQKSRHEEVKERPELAARVSASAERRGMRGGWVEGDVGVTSATLFWMGVPVTINR